MYMQKHKFNFLLPQMPPSDPSPNIIHVCLFMLKSPVEIHTCNYQQKTKFVKEIIQKQQTIFFPMKTVPPFSHTFKKLDSIKFQLITV